MIEEYEIVDYGVEHGQYFQGAGVTFSQWMDCYVGVGANYNEAARDAIDNCATSGWDTTTIEDIPEDYSNVAHKDCPEDDDMCELNYYAILYVR
jgi:hypothetical protein